MSITEYVDHHFANLARAIPTRCRRKRLADLAERLANALDLEHLRVGTLERIIAANDEHIKVLHDWLNTRGDTINDLRATIAKLRNRVDAAQNVPTIGNGHDNVRRIAKTMTAIVMTVAERAEEAMILVLDHVEFGNNPIPTTWPASWYLYADDVVRLALGLPLRERATGQYYLNADEHADKRTLPFKGYPVRDIGGGMCRIDLGD